MGAIAGVLYPELFPSRHVVQDALEALASRSPAEPHTYLFKNLEFGSRGMTIAHDEHHTVTLAMDAEFLNEEELRLTLRKAGFRVEGLGRGELVVRAYEHWGKSFVENLEGSFAIALFDHRRHELMLMRDPLGAKPLYWGHINGTFLFASELKALLATGMVPQAPAKEALGAYLYFGYIPQDLTPIKGINKLLPGNRLRYSEKRGLSVENYWSYGSRLLIEHPPASPEERTERLGELLKNAVDRQVTQNGPLGYVASGSAGSAAICYSLAHSDAKDRTRGLSLEFAGQWGGPSPLADQLGMAQSAYTMTPGDLLEDLVRVVWQLDEPGADPASVGLWRLCNQNRGKITSLCADVGSDEILATHARYPIAPSSLTPPIQTLWGRALSTLVRPLLGRLDPGSGFRMMRWLHSDPWYMEHVREEALCDPRTLRSLSPVLARNFAPDIYLHRFHNLSNLQMRPSSYLYFDTRIVLADKLLQTYDRLTSANEMRWWSPYLDTNVVDFMAAMPDVEKLNPDEALRPLRRLLAGAMPGQTFTSAPPAATSLAPWLHDASIRRVFEYLREGTLVEGGWISSRWLRHALSGKGHNPASFGQLWALLVLEIWFRLFINGPVSTTPPELSVVELLRRQ